MVIAAAAHDGTATGRILGTAVPRWLGQRSYGIYLYHWPILVLSGVDGDTPARPLEAVTRIGATLLVAELSYRTVETPIRRSLARVPHEA